MASTFDTGDVPPADAAPPAEACVDLVGGGCFGAPQRPCAAPAEADSSVHDTGECESCGWGGGAGGCATAPGPAVSLWIVLLLFVARTAFAVDVQQLQWLDGGPLPGIVDPGLAEPFSGRLVVGGSHAVDPVRLRMGDEFMPLVTSLDSIEVAGSLQIADWFRAGVVVPGHRVGVAGDEPQAGVGAVVPFLVAPLGPGVAAMGSLEIAHRGSPDFVSQPATSFGFTAAREVGPLLAAGQARARLQGKAVVPGVAWGHRLEVQAGARTQGRASVGTQVVLGAPLTLFLAPAAGAWPVETLAFGSVEAAPGVHLDAGAGVGSTFGLGTARWRALAAVRFQGTPGDRDGDHIGDLVDRCPARPEDADGFRDRDGCPDPDNDRDGFVDAADACPDDAEVHNGLDDEDGCPDALGEWQIVVVGDEVEQLRIGVDDEGVWGLERRLAAVVAPGPHRMRVDAPGHRPVDAMVDVPEGRSRTEVRLEPLQFGTLHVSLVGEGGAPLAGEVVVEEVTHDVPEGGAGWQVPSGALLGAATAPGHLPSTFRARVEARGEVAVEVVLEPELPQVRKPSVLFGLDSDRLVASAAETLDALAGWLAAHPAVRLLRIEGHADELGSPAYNYDLSRRRAEAVRTGLVARGIADDRLVPVGAGEALQAGQPAREVTFLVLVWDEAPPAAASAAHSR